MNLTPHASSLAVLGILHVLQLATDRIPARLRCTLAFWLCTLALNVVLTALIVARLVFYRQRFAAAAARYTGVVAMVVESALLYTAVLAGCLGPFVWGRFRFVDVFVEASLVQVRVAGASGPR